MVSNFAQAHACHAMTHLRLFLALWPDAAALRQLAGHVGGWSWPPGCVLYAPSDWHVTLHFIGQVPAVRLPEITEGLNMPTQPFTLRLDRPALWTHGLAVLCASQLPQPLQSLHGRLGQALQGLGLPAGMHPYQPHATLARRADAAQPPAACAPVEWQASSFVLAASTGDRDCRYRVMRRYG